MLCFIQLKKELFRNKYSASHTVSIPLSMMKTCAVAGVVTVEPLDGPLMSTNKSRVPLDSVPSVMSTVIVVVDSPFGNDRTVPASEV